jgi:hypothetical protein
MGPVPSDRRRNVMSFRVLKPGNFKVHSLVKMYPFQLTTILPFFQLFSLLNFKKFEPKLSYYFKAVLFETTPYKDLCHHSNPIPWRDSISRPVAPVSYGVNNDVNFESRKRSILFSCFANVDWIYNSCDVIRVSPDTKKLL